MQELLYGQNPTKKPSDFFDAHSQTGNDTGKLLLFGERMDIGILGSFSNTESLSSSAWSNEVLRVPTNACVRSEVSKGSESVKSPVRSNTSNTRTRLDQNLIDGGRQPRTSDLKSILSSELVSWLLEESESIKTPVWSRQSLMEAATAKSEDRVDVAWEILTCSSAMPNLKGNSEKKLLKYMLSALKSRVRPIDNPPPVAELFTKDHLLSAQSLYDLSPCFKLGFMAANLAILEAASEQPSTSKLHVIDFDIGLEGQYEDLLLLLSKRQAGNQSTLKITTLADSFNSEERLTMFEDRLSELAANMGIRLVFKVVSQKLSELSRDSLGCEPDEVLAVNLAFKLYRMPDESVSVENPRAELLRCVKGLAPQVVTLVEQEMNGNTAPFMVRVEEALAYYGALLESIEFTFSGGDTERLRVEEGLSRKLGNSVACEGRYRVERSEVFGEWRARMEMAGFELKPLDQHVVELLKARLGSELRKAGLGTELWNANAMLGAEFWKAGLGSWDPAFTVKEENGGVCFGWGDRTLTVASTWR
ncbi:hypothetical protein BT93_A0441 [Corymbia citriodora subsp. variegata]|nr:hypothetical protein BT93_A0441 [Corymbia citriodora subsp. variegata]